jgi:type VI secretion system secreted protein Hcp
MAAHMFMKIDSVQGESEDGTHANQVEVTGWNWGATQTGSASSGKGAGTGKASVSDLTYTAYVDRSVPTLLNMLLLGTPFDSAQLSICKATGAETLDYLVIKMTNGLISGVTFTGNPGDELQAVNVSLNFAAVEVDYTPQTHGGTGAVVTMNYQINKAAKG